MYKGSRLEKFEIPNRSTWSPLAIAELLGFHGSILLSLPHHAPQWYYSNVILKDKHHSLTIFFGQNFYSYNPIVYWIQSLQNAPIISRL